MHAVCDSSKPKILASNSYEICPRDNHDLERRARPGKIQSNRAVLPMFRVARLAFKPKLTLQTPQKNIVCHITSDIQLFGVLGGLSLAAAKPFRMNHHIPRHEVHENKYQQNQAGEQVNSSQ